MRSSSERRMSIIETLSERRSDSIDNLAFEFGVSRRTMRNDKHTSNRQSDKFALNLIASMNSFHC